MTDVTVTCTTEGCENANIPIDIEPPRTETGDIDPGWMGVFCGPCNAQLHTHSEGQA